MTIAVCHKHTAFQKVQKFNTLTSQAAVKSAKLLQERTVPLSSNRLPCFSSFISFSGNIEQANKLKTQFNQGIKINYIDLYDNYEYLKDLFQKPWTPYDTPEIIDARNSYAKTLSDYRKTTGRRDTIQINSPDRIKLRRHIVDKLYGDGAALKQRQAYFLLGLPGSGKSSIINNYLKQETGGLVIDGDDVRELLPEYKIYQNHCIIREEKSLLKNALLEKAVANGDNLIIPNVTINPAKLEKLKEKDYSIHLVYVDTDVENSINRTFERYKRTGRFSDPYHIVELSKEMKGFYEMTKSMPNHLFATHEEYSNTQPIGQKPKLVEHCIGFS